MVQMQESSGDKNVSVRRAMAMKEPPPLPAAPPPADTTHHPTVIINTLTDVISKKGN